MERYLVVLKSYKRMPAELEQILRENVHPLTVRKNEIIQPEENDNDCLYFVEKGLFRLFMDKHGIPATLRFKREDEFIVSMKELPLAQKMPSSGIEALEDGLLWIFPGSLVSRLIFEYPQFTLQFSNIIMKDWVSVTWGIRCSDPDAGSANYDRLRQYSPELLDRVPIPYLADYTSIPEKIFRHLHSSKIRLKVSTTRRRKR
jgi:hypothetical protein